MLIVSEHQDTKYFTLVYENNLSSSCFFLYYLITSELR